MLTRQTLLERDGVAIDDVSCQHASGRGHTTESSATHALVFVRRGCFVRSCDGADSLLDPTTAYCTNPGEEERFDHPHSHGDHCTVIRLVPALVASLMADDLTLPRGALPNSPTLDLGHRRLLSSGRRDPDPAELAEGAVNLAADALDQVTGRRIAAGRPTTQRARRTLVDHVREALAADPNQSLPQMARTLAVSPHHLSRVFRAETGSTISRHRMRLRVRAALERFAEGEHDLARLAADVGFADQSHLHRVLRSETRELPSRLREELTSRCRRRLDSEALD